MVVDVSFVTTAKEQPEMLLLMPSGIGEQPMQHGTERCDTRAGGDKDGIVQGRPQDKVTERPLASDFLAFFDVAEKVRHEAVLHAVQAESKPVFVFRRGRDGIITVDFSTVSRPLFRRP